MLELTDLQALLVIFRSKLVDSKGSHSTLEKCEVRLEESNDRAACRLVIKMLCGQGKYSSLHCPML